MITCSSFWILARSEEDWPCGLIQFADNATTPCAKLEYVAVHGIETTIMKVGKALPNHNLSHVQINTVGISNLGLHKEKFVHFPIVVTPVEESNIGEVVSISVRSAEDVLKSMKRLEVLIARKDRVGMRKHKIVDLQTIPPEAPYARMTRETKISITEMNNNVPVYQQPAITTNDSQLRKSPKGLLDSSSLDPIRIQYRKVAIFILFYGPRLNYTDEAKTWWNTEIDRITNSKGKLNKNWKALQNPVGSELKQLIDELSGDEVDIENLI